jgi:hypothetical protein
VTEVEKAPKVEEHERIASKLAMKWTVANEVVKSDSKWLAPEQNIQNTFIRQLIRDGLTFLSLLPLLAEG